ncbi:MAG: acetylornithine transaminase [Actinobacteria bacterium]|nr:acetylornithine transaminase [Actinomycetota bacterium]
MNLNELIQLDNTYHMTTYSRLPVTFVKGKGTRLWDDTGKEYLDLLSGIGVVGVGHCHPVVVDAIKNQLESLMHVSNLFYTEPQLELASKIADISFGDRCFFGNSGAEANEGAIKLARRYAKIRGKDAYEIITAFRSFHGRTMKTLAATGQPDKQRPFEPLPPGFKHVPLNDIEALKKEINGKTCAVMLEVIQGEGGVYPCDESYLKEIRALCDERDILLIFDEVQTGIGRTGNMFAYQGIGVEPDIMTLAKGIASGLPIGVLVASEKVSLSFKPGEHGSTFGGGPAVCAAALATIKVIEEEGLVDNSRKIGAHIVQKLEAIKESGSLVKEIRGAGLMLAIELKEGKAGGIVLDLLKEGIVANNIGNTIIRLLPPLCITKAEVDEALSVLERLIV